MARHTGLFARVCVAALVNALPCDAAGDEGAAAGLLSLASRTDAAAGAALSSSSGTVASDLVTMLDRDGSGDVDMSEMVEFATGQGLNALEVREEFQGLDRDGDGVLSAAELAEMPGLTDADLADDVEKEDATDSVTSASTVIVPPATPSLPSAAAKSTSDGSATADAAGVTPDALQEIRAVAANIAAAATDNATKALAQKEESPEKAVLKIDSLSAQESSNVAWLRRAGDEAVRGAARAAAALFAQEANKVLAARGKHEADAGKYESRAKSLRANLTELVSSAPRETEVATHAAVAQVMNEALPKLQALEADAKKASADAKDRSDRATAAFLKATTAQESMVSAVRRLTLPEQ